MDMLSGMRTYTMTIEGKMFGKATRGRKRIELLRDMMEWRDCDS